MNCSNKKLYQLLKLSSSGFGSFPQPNSPLINRVINRLLDA